MIRDLFYELGYSKDDYDLFVSKYEYSLNENLYKRIKRNFDLFLVLGFSRSDIIYMTRRVYSIFNLSSDYIVKRFNYFISFGYSKDKVRKIIRNNPSLLIFSDDYLKDTFDSFRSFGYDDRSIIKMSSRIPSILNHRGISSRIDFMETIGFKDSDIKRIGLICPSIFTVSDGYISKRIKFLKGLGYDPTGVICKLPTLINLSESNILDKINGIVSLGFSFDEAINMTSSYPSLFSHSLFSIRENMRLFLINGYTLEDTLNICKSTPSILGFSNSTLMEKIEFYNKNGLNNFIINHPKCLIQSIDLTKKRISFFEKNGIEYKDYLLFIDKKSFNKRFGV